MAICVHFVMAPGNCFNGIYSFTVSIKRVKVTCIAWLIRVPKNMCYV